MSSKIYVLDGAILECNQGFTPGKLTVTQNQKVKIQGQFKATHLDNQVTPFGQCKLKPTNSGYLPCVPALQPWTKTTESTKLGGNKKFLFEDSECMCSTGGKITVTQPMQINTAGAVSEQFKDIASIIPGAMLGNDKAPKVIETYWMDEAKKKKIDKIQYGEKAQIFVLTENISPGEVINVKVKEVDEKVIDGKESILNFSGTILADGTAKLDLLETQEDWNIT